MLFAISLPLVVGGAGLGVETTYWRYKQVQVQAAADAAAYAAAVEKRRGSTDTVVTTAAQTAATQNGFGSGSTTTSVSFPTLVNGVAVTNAVQVTLQTQAQRFFTAYFSNTPVDVRAVAVANYSNTGQACILALDPAASSAVYVSGSAVLQMQGCSIMANSISATAASTAGSSTTTVPCIVSGGGVSLSGTVNLTECDAAVTDAAPAADPYKSIAQPTPTGACKNAGNGATLNPDYYCDLQINKSVTFNPGVYYVASQFKLNGNADISGDGVTIVMVGDARVDINGTARVRLKAPVTGTYAGILFFGDRASIGGTGNSFNGTADSLLTGALYFPTQPVEYLGNFSGVSGCTQVIGKTIKWSGNATIKQDCASLGLKSVPTPGAVRLVG